MSGFAGLHPHDVDLHRGLVRCPGCDRWAGSLSTSFMGGLRCFGCIRRAHRERCRAEAAADPVIRAGLRLFGGPLRRAGGD